MFERVDHVGPRVRGADTSIKFFEKLGFSVMARFHESSGEESAG